MRVTSFSLTVFILTATINTSAATILLADGNSSIKVYDRLIGLGNSVTVSDALDWGSRFDYSAYDVVAFQYGSNNPLDINNFLNAVDSNQVGTVFFRGYGTQATALALGLISSTNADELSWQSPAQLDVVNNSHYITSGLSLGITDLGYAYMSAIPTPGADTTVLGRGTAAAALLVHNKRRAAITPFYGHSSNYDLETQAGLDITQRSIDWAATPAVPVPAAVWLFASGLLGLFGLARRKAR